MGGNKFSGKELKYADILLNDKKLEQREINREIKREQEIDRKSKLDLEKMIITDLICPTCLSYLHKAKTTRRVRCSYCNFQGEVVGKLQIIKETI